MPEPLLWQIATVTGMRAETPDVSTFTLALPAWRPHRAGQHYDVRLTAGDGYQAQRSYSIASPPSRSGEIDLTVERIADGEVSPYFHDVVEVGDRVEVRGPIGGYFVWEPALGGPLLLIAGGSGVVPLMAMLRERASKDPKPPAVLLSSSRTFDDVIYREELDSLAAGDAGFRLIQTLTRSQPPGWTGHDRRIDGPMLREAMTAVGQQPLAYICGPTLLVEAAANGLVDLGVPPGQVRTERFGPTSDEETVLNDPMVLDANAVAGDLAELFGFEVTAASHRCAHCGNVAAVGTLLAWTHGPGVTLRCSGCRGVVVRMVRTPTRTYLDISGAAYLEVRSG